MFSRCRTSVVIAVLCWAAFGTVRPATAQDDWVAPDWYMSPAQAEEWRRSPGSFKDRDAMKAVKLTPAQLQAVQRVVAYYLSRLAHNDVTNLPREVVERFISEIDSPLTSTDARTAMMDSIIARSQSLLQHPNSLIRTNAMWLLNQLSVKKPEMDRTTGFEIPAVPYNPTYKILLQVLRDKNQLLECRIAAAWGLARICRDGAPGSPSSVEKSEIAVALVEALDETPLSTQEDILWFRGRLIEALGCVDRINDVQERPIVVDTLLKVIANPKETFDNRALAAKSISQLPYPGSMNVPLVTYEIAKLLRDMTVAYNKQPQYGGWRRAFTNVYLAFRPAKAKEAKERRWGLLYVTERPGLQTHVPLIQSAWKVVQPVTVYVMGNKQPPIPNGTLQALNEWVEKNAPSNRSIMPGAAPLP